MPSSKEQESILPSWLHETESSEKDGETEPLVSNGSNPSYSFHSSYSAVEDDVSQSDSDETADAEAPRKNLCLHVFGLFNMFAIVTCLRLLLMQLYPLLFVPWQEVGFLQITLRIYVSLVCVLFVLVELETPIAYVRDSAVLQNYISRGFVYSFVGLIGMEESYAVFVEQLKAEQGRAHAYDEFHIAWETLFIKGSSLAMVVLGFVYMTLGAFCLKGLRDRLRKAHEDDMERHRQVTSRQEKRKEKSRIASWAMVARAASFLKKNSGEEKSDDSSSFETNFPGSETWKENSDVEPNEFSEARVFPESAWNALV